MSKGLVKEALRSISKNKARFISIIAIVAVGISFFAGISAAGPDMKQTAVEYYEENNLMDIWMISTVGFNQHDVDAIRNIEGVESATGSKFADGTVVVDGKTAANVDGGQAICRAYGLNLDFAKKYEDGVKYKDYINRLTLLEGRLPQKENECVIDRSDMATPKGFEIGKTIKMVGIEENIENKLNVTEYKIVGVIRTPRYISFERGQTDVGSGTLGCFIYVPESAFKMDYYTEICATVEGAEDFYPFSEEYYKHVEPVIKKIESISAEHLEIRVNEATAEYRKQLQKGEAEYEKKKKEVEAELGNAFTELEYYKNLVQNGDAQIAAAEAQLQAILSSKQNELTSGKNQYDTAKKEYDEKYKQWEDGNKQVVEYEARLEELKQLVVEQDQLMADLKVEIDEIQAEINAFPQPDTGEPETDESGEVIPPEEDPELTELKALLKEKKTARRQAASSYTANVMEISTINQNLPVAKAQLADGKVQLDAAKKELDKYSGMISGGQSQIATSEAQARAEIARKRQELAEGKEKLAKYNVEYNEAYEDAYAQLDEAKYDIEEAKAKLEEASSNPRWMVNDRRMLPGYENYGQTSQNIEAFAKVFPVFFFFIAAMVVLTTMTRMVDEERTQIGTLKALGFKDSQIRAKYLIYSLVATFIGSILGLIAGYYAYPNAIMTAYEVVFQLPPLIILFPVKLTVLGVIFSVLSTTIATYLSCRKEMAAKPSELMRAKAPRTGRRVLLEKVPFIWSHLNFSAKATIRNLMRNKKRAFVTFFGIVGCMALLLTGFGLNDSTDQILTAQYGAGGVSSFDAQIALKNSQISANESAIYNNVLKNKNIKDAMMVYNRSVVGSSQNSDDTLSVYLLVPQTAEKLTDFVDLRSRTTDKKYKLGDDGVIITEKFAKKAKVSVGDSVDLKFNDELTIKVAVTGIVENYAFHYAYMSPVLYSQIFQKPVAFNYMYAKYADGIRGTQKVETVATELMKFNDINAVVDAEQTIRTFDELFDCLNLVIAIFIISAALLAFIVLYTLTSININERRREIASLKVFGFHNKEATSYVGRENYIITAIAIAVGVVFGYYLHKIVVAQAEVNVVMFGRIIEPLSYVYSIGLTILFAIIVNVVMHFVIKRIDMVESLKSID
ncbi:MAG: FtsX-like permease family protein [Clostridia bacterium]|nr:FtsX-like permease family protein [Clostridia bacterium]